MVWRQSGSARQVATREGGGVPVNGVDLARWRALGAPALWLASLLACVAGIAFLLVLDVGAMRALWAAEADVHAFHSRPLDIGVSSAPVAAAAPLLTGAG